MSIGSFFCFFHILLVTILHDRCYRCLDQAFNELVRIADLARAAAADARRNGDSYGMTAPMNVYGSRGLLSNCREEIVTQTAHL